MAEAQPQPFGASPEVPKAPKEQLSKPLYSEKYYDDVFEYRHVFCPREIAGKIPRNRLMSEKEWRDLGIHQSAGWIHYTIHVPERHILLFKRKLPKKAPSPKKPLSPPRKIAARGQLAASKNYIQQGTV